MAKGKEAAAALKRRFPNLREHWKDGYSDELRQWFRENHEKYGYSNWDSLRRGIRNVLKRGGMERRLARLEIEVAQMRRDFEGVCAGGVYLARTSGGEYKIGVTNHVQRRAQELRRGNGPHPLNAKIVYVVSSDDPQRLETYLKRLFRGMGRQVRGEWFALTSDDVALITGMSTVTYEGEGAARV